MPNIDFSTLGNDRFVANFAESTLAGCGGPDSRSIIFNGIKHNCLNGANFETVAYLGDLTDAYHDCENVMQCVRLLKEIRLVASGIILKHNGQC